MLDHALLWLNVPEHRVLLTWIGGGLSTLCSGIWAVVKFLRSREQGSTKGNGGRTQPVVEARAIHGSTVHQETLIRNGLSGTEIALLLGVAVGGILILAALFLRSAHSSSGTIHARTQVDAKDCSVGIGGDVSGGNFNISCDEADPPKIDEDLLQNIQVGGTIEAAEDILGKPARRIGRVRIYKILDSQLEMDLCPGKDGSTIVTQFVRLHDVDDDEPISGPSLNFVPKSRLDKGDGVIFGKSKLADLFKLGSLNCDKTGSGNGASKFNYISLACTSWATISENVHYEFGSDDIPDRDVDKLDGQAVSKDEIGSMRFTAYYAALDPNNAWSFANAYEGSTDVYFTLSDDDETDLKDCRD